MMDSIYFRQAELVLRVLPLVDREAVCDVEGKKEGLAERSTL